MTKRQEAKKVLELLGMPTEQQSDICCYSLLALLNLSSSSSWSAATNEWTRIHDILAFLRKTYRGVRYAENSRETFRKQAMHHFRTAAIIEDNGRVGCERTQPHDPSERQQVPGASQFSDMSKKSTQLSLFDSPHADRGWIAFLNETLQLPQERPYLAIDLLPDAADCHLASSVRV